MSFSFHFFGLICSLLSQPRKIKQLLNELLFSRGRTAQSLPLFSFLHASCASPQLRQSRSRRSWRQCGGEQRENQERKKKRKSSCRRRRSPSFTRVASLAYLNSASRHRLALLCFQTHHRFLFLTFSINNGQTGRPRPRLCRPARRPRRRQVRLCHRRRVAPQVGRYLVVPQGVARIGPRRRPRQGERDFDTERERERDAG